MRNIIESAIVSIVGLFGIHGSTLGILCDDVPKGAAVGAVDGSVVVVVGRSHGPAFTLDVGARSVTVAHTVVHVALHGMSLGSVEMVGCGWGWGSPSTLGCVTGRSRGWFGSFNIPVGGLAILPGTPWFLWSLSERPTCSTSWPHAMTTGPFPGLRVGLLRETISIGHDWPTLKYLSIPPKRILVIWFLMSSVKLDPLTPPI